MPLIRSPRPWSFSKAIFDRSVSAWNFSPNVAILHDLVVQFAGRTAPARCGPAAAAVRRRPEQLVPVEDEAGHTRVALARPADLGECLLDAARRHRPALLVQELHPLQLPLRADRHLDGVVLGPYGRGRLTEFGARTSHRGLGRRETLPRLGDTCRHLFIQIHLRSPLPRTT